MSDKKLLEESTIRRFQTLANIKPLNVLEEGKKKPASKGKEEKPAGGRKTSSAMKPEDSEKRAAGKELEEGLEEETVEEMYMDQAEGEEKYMEEAEGEEAGGDMDMGGSEEAGGEGGDDVKPEVEALVSALNGLLAKVGKGELEVDVEAGAEGGEGEEAGGEEEAPVMEAKKKKEEKKEKEEMMKEAKKKKPAEKEKEKEEEGVYESLNLEVEDDEALAEELTRRVAARLVAEMKKAKKGVTEDFTGGGTKHTKPPKAKGNPSKAGSFGTKGKGR